MEKKIRKRRISKGERKISNFLEKYFIKYTREKTFDSCLSLKGNPLRFDFYLNDYNILIEYDGTHHFKPVNRYKRAKKSFTMTTQHDLIKNTFAKDNKIQLLRIHHKYYKKLDLILEELFKRLNIEEVNHE